MATPRRPLGKPPGSAQGTSRKATCPARERKGTNSPKPGRAGPAVTERKPRQASGPPTPRDDLRRRCEEFGHRFDRADSETRQRNEEPLRSPDRTPPFSPSPNATDEKISGAGSWSPDSFTRVLSSASRLDQGEDRIKVCLRVRPLNSDEVAAGELSCVIVERPVCDSLQLAYRGADYHLDGEQSFSFDWVLSGDVQQERAYQLVGDRVVSGVVDGFHGCAFAYGQTGSGKSHTIFGRHGVDEGLLPRIAAGLLRQLDDEGSEYILKLSYLEIYNEKLRDLLKPARRSGSKVLEEKSLEVRQHPKCGVFVDNLTSNVVKNLDDLQGLLDYGHQIRVVRCTNMNAQSSRSHAVVTISVERTIQQEGKTFKRRAQLHCVDLAGSERMKNIGGSKKREAESKVINRSLLALSITISRLSSGQDDARTHIPYRNSKLTYLLSDSLMGNCRTVMLACVSPSMASFSMTESTIRFAQSVKKIRTKPRQNDDLDGTLVSNLRAEIEHLRQQLSRSRDSVGSGERASLMEKLDATQHLEKEFGTSWEEHEARSAAQQQGRRRTLQDLGLRHGLVSTDSMLWVRQDSDPYIVNICDDPLLSGCLTYTLPPNVPVRVGSDASCTIHVEGLGIKPDMCQIVSRGGTVEVIVSTGKMLPTADQNPRSDGVARRGGLVRFRGLDDGEDADCRNGAETASARQSIASTVSQRSRCSSRKALLKSGAALVYVNSTIVLQSHVLRDGDRLRVGLTHVFRVCNPQEAMRPEEEKMEEGRRMSGIIEAITQDGTSERINAQQFASQMRERVGVANTEKMLLQFQEVLPLIEEANYITEELRDDENHDIVFKAHMLTHVLSADVCELAVALCIVRKADDMDEKGRPVFSGDEPREMVSKIWTKQVFLTRLEAMRDLYNEVTERGESWGEPGDSNPWQEHETIPVIKDDTQEGVDSLELCPQTRGTLLGRSPELFFETPEGHDERHGLMVELGQVRAEQVRLDLENARSELAQASKSDTEAHRPSWRGLTRTEPVVDGANEFGTVIAFTPPTDLLQPDQRPVDVGRLGGSRDPVTQLIHGRQVGTERVVSQRRAPSEHSIRRHRSFDSGSWGQSGCQSGCQSGRATPRAGSSVTPPAACWHGWFRTGSTYSATCGTHQEPKPIMRAPPLGCPPTGCGVARTSSCPRARSTSPGSSSSASQNAKVIYRGLSPARSPPVAATPQFLSRSHLNTVRCGSPSSSVRTAITPCQPVHRSCEVSSTYSPLRGQPTLSVSSGGLQDPRPGTMRYVAPGPVHAAPAFTSPLPVHLPYVLWDLARWRPRQWDTPRPYSVAGGRHACEDQ